MTPPASIRPNGDGAKERPVRSRSSSRQFLIGFPTRQEAVDALPTYQALIKEMGLGPQFKITIESGWRYAGGGRPTAFALYLRGPFTGHRVR